VASGEAPAQQLTRLAEDDKIKQAGAELIAVSVDQQSFMVDGTNDRRQIQVFPMKRRRSGLRNRQRS
jgi:hypothetical protein